MFNVPWHTQQRLRGDDVRHKVGPNAKSWHGQQRTQRLRPRHVAFAAGPRQKDHILVFSPRHLCQLIQLKQRDRSDPCLLFDRTGLGIGQELNVADPPRLAQGVAGLLVFIPLIQVVCENTALMRSAFFVPRGGSELPLVFLPEAR